MQQPRIKLGLLLAVFMVALTMSIGWQAPAQAQTQPSPTTPLSAVQIDLQAYTSGLTLPVNMAHAGDGSGRLFVVEKRGTIRIVHAGSLVETPFLDITRRVRSQESERGLLGLAFHPKYKDNGLFFVYYTNLEGDIVIARYKVSSSPDVADPASGKILLTVDHKRYANHNGGELEFGPDGYLYAGLGDGGSAGDPFKNGQNTKALLAKILRLDVDKGDPYGIPADNPFADGKNGRPEVWAYGLRNPWRFSFDRANGDLYIADVGQDAYEEIDVQRAGTPGGRNYGWSIMEGLHCYPPFSNCSAQGLTVPVAEYGHDKGCSVTGGYVYRGKSYPKLTGTYFFSDYCTGRIWAMQPDTSNAWKVEEKMVSGLQVSTFGEDEAGEVYIADYSKGAIYRLVDKTQS